MQNNTKILVCADVHGNYDVLCELEKTSQFKTADIKIFLGDVVVGFSRPNECVEFLTKHNFRCLLGNNDSYVCDHIPQVDLQDFSVEKLKQVEYMRKLLTNQNQNIINSWPKQLYIKLGAKTLYFTHYMWEQYQNDYNVVDFPPTKCFETRKQMFKDIDADYIFFGHEHNTECYADGKQYIYAIGSFGVRNPGEYAIVEVDENGVKVEFESLGFDLEQEIKRVEDAGYPYNKNKIKGKKS